MNSIRKLIPSAVTTSLDLAFKVLRRGQVDIRLERGMISFSFDDFPADALSNGGKILEEHGCRGTYYAASGLAGSTGACGAIATHADLNDCLLTDYEIIGMDTGNGFTDNWPL